MRVQEKSMFLIVTNTNIFTIQLKLHIVVNNIRR